MQLIYNKKNEQLQETGEAIRDFAVEVKEYQQKLNEFIERRPERANDFKATMENMTLVLNTRKEKYAIAKKKIINNKFKTIKTILSITHLLSYF